MARARCLLPLLATFLVAGSRAAGQPVPPTPLPPAHPDPAAVLLPPVGVFEHTAPQREMFPPEPAARLRPAVESTAFKPPTDLPDDRDSLPAPRPGTVGRNWDAYDYLTDRATARPRTDGLPRVSRAGDDPTFFDRAGDRVEGILDGIRQPREGKRGWFCTDTAFDGFISPVTNPFLFETAQTVTEARVIAIGQGIPKGAGPFEGGSTYFFGGQGRVAFGERFSLTVNKIGVNVFSPGTGSAVSSSNGLSELWLGPKFVVLRNVESQTLVTVGAIFQLPIGGTSAYQHTGKLSIAPYVSVAQKLFGFADWGTLRAQANAGYSIATNRERSDYFYLNGHLNWDWRDRGKFFPLVEVNWYQYTANGTSSGFGVEGRDLANFGATVGRSGLLTGALGARYKINERWQFGGAFEMPFAGNKDLFRYRFTMDLIWRY